MIKNIFKNESGMSLVSVTVAAGIMAMLGVYMMRMQENQLKTQNDMIARSEINNFISKLNGLFTRPGYCEKTFEALKISPDSEVSINQIIAPNGLVIYEMGKKYGENNFRLESIEQDNFFYDTEDENSGILSLKVTVEKLKKSFGTKKIVKKIEVIVSLDESGLVRGCGTMTAGSGVDTGRITEDIKTEEIKKAIIEPSKSNPITKKMVEEMVKESPGLKLLQESIKSIEASNAIFKKKEEEALKALEGN